MSIHHWRVSRYFNVATDNRDIIFGTGNSDVINSHGGNDIIFAEEVMIILRGSGDDGIFWRRRHFFGLNKDGMSTSSNEEELRDLSFGDDIVLIMKA